MCNRRILLKKRSKRNTETDKQTNKSETKTHFGFRDVRVFTGETAANKQDIKKYCTCFKGNCCLKKQKQYVFETRGRIIHFKVR